MTRARDMRKRNARLHWSIRHNPAVAALYPATAKALAAEDANAPFAEANRALAGADIHRLEHAR